jgi:hypothetical protein
MRQLTHFGNGAGSAKCWRTVGAVVRRLTRVDSAAAELAPGLVRDLLLRNQLVVGIHRNLHVVANGNMRVGCHRPAVGVSQRDLILSGPIRLRQHRLASFASLPHRGNFLRQMLDLRTAGLLLSSIARVEALRVVIELLVASAINSVSDARVKLRSLLLTALIRVPSTANSSRPNRSSCLRSKQHELAEHWAEGFAVVAAEVGDRLEVWLEMPQQPDHLYIAVGLGFEPAAGTDADQVAIYIYRA